MIRLSVDSGRVVAKFQRIQAGMRPRLVMAVNAALIELQGYIKGQKLHGGVLQARTGNLSRAITVTAAADSGGGRIAGSVGVDKSAPYGRFHELGVDHSWVIEPRNSGALRFEVGGRVVFAKRVVHPPLKQRSFMRSSLDEKRAAILERLRASVREGIR